MGTYYILFKIELFKDKIFLTVVSGNINSKAVGYRDDSLQPFYLYIWLAVNLDALSTFITSLSKFTFHSIFAKK